MTVLSLIPISIKALRPSSFDAYGFGYLLGTFLFHFLLGYLSYWIIKKGIQLTKKKKINDLAREIDSIE